MFNLFKNLSKKQILFICGGLLLLMVGVIVLYIFNLITETFFTVGLFLLIIFFTSLTSSLIQRKIEKKLEDKKKGKIHKFEGNLSFDKPLKVLKSNYGNVEVYVADKVLYALVKVESAEIFFSEEQQQVKYNVDTKKYNKLIQFYLFDVNDYAYFRKISIINYQSDKFYVASFIADYELKTIYQSDDVKRNAEYEPIYNEFLKLINISEDQG